MISGRYWVVGGSRAWSSGNSGFETLMRIKSFTVRYLAAFFILGMMFPILKAAESLYPSAFGVAGARGAYAMILLPIILVGTGKLVTGLLVFALEIMVTVYAASRMRGLKSHPVLQVLFTVSIMPFIGFGQNIVCILWGLYQP